MMRVFVIGAASGQMEYRYSHVIGFLSVSGRGFNNPVDMVVGDAGMLYVLNRAGSDVQERMVSKRITICTAGEDYVGEFAVGGTAPGQMMWPCAMAQDASGNLFVSDEALNRISVFGTDGDFLGCWGVRGRGAGEFNRPAGIAFDGEGNLLVADGLNHRVQRYTADGRFLGQWGRHGTAVGEFSVPWGVCVDGAGSVYVADWRNDRVQKFDADGGFLAVYGGGGDGANGGSDGSGFGGANGGAGGGFYRPSGVTVDADGNMYVADWGRHRVRILDRAGDLLADFRGDAGVSGWSDDYFRVNPDEWAERQKADLEPELDAKTIYDVRDESASIEKYFWSPTAVKLDGAGRMYVVDSCRHRVQVYARGDG